MHARCSSSVLAIAACGGGRRRAAAPRGPAGAAGRDRRRAATTSRSRTVNGRPVWGSCVAAQAARGATTREAGARRSASTSSCSRRPPRRAGSPRDPEVADATRTALVSQLVATDFEARYRTPRTSATCRPRSSNATPIGSMHGRSCARSTYVRVEVPKDAPPEADAAAHALAEQIAARARGPSPACSSAHLPRARADRLAARRRGLRVTDGDTAQRRASASSRRTRDALFAIPEVGRTSPRRCARQWGWDVILWTERLAGRGATRARSSPREMFPERAARRTSSSGSTSSCKTLGDPDPIDPRSSRGSTRRPAGDAVRRRSCRRAVQATPGAIGGAFADSRRRDGRQLRDATTRTSGPCSPRTTASCCRQLHAAFGTWHFGGPEYFIAQHDAARRRRARGRRRLLRAARGRASRRRTLGARARAACARPRARAARGDGVNARPRCALAVARSRVLAGARRRRQPPISRRLRSVQPGVERHGELRRARRGHGLRGRRRSARSSGASCRPSDILVLVYPLQRVDPAQLGAFVQAGGNVVIADDFGEGKDAMQALGLLRAEVAHAARERVLRRPHVGADRDRARRSPARAATSATSSPITRRR